MTKMARVLITEQLAQPGIELLRSKGHDVQISLICLRMASAEIAEAGLIVRSATQLTSDHWTKLIDYKSSDVPELGLTMSI